MPIVYSYLRFSKPEQMLGDSQRRQLESSEAWAAKHNLTLDESLDLQDLGVSAFRGRNAEQGALGLFLDCIESGRVKPGDYLVLESLDRLTRQRMSSALPLLQDILRSGVQIVTLNPERIYTQASVDDLGALIEIVVVLARAYEESALKSKRVSAAWANKRKNAATKKLTAVCPSWLRLSEDRSRFELIRDRVKVVKRIFRLSRDGIGSGGIAKQLNADNVPTFGRAPFWQDSYVKKILSNRAVLGEYQPYRTEDGQRVPAGDPVSDYFPPIIDEATFYAVQQGLAQRCSQRGRHGRGVRNLFTGLLVDARDGSRLSVVDKGEGPRLVSSAARAGRPGSLYLAFPLEYFERSLLLWGYDLELGDVLPTQASNVAEQLLEVEGKIADLEHRIDAVKAKLATAGNLDALLDALVDLETKRNECKQRQEHLKQEQATQVGDALDRTRELIEKLRSADEDGAYAMRMKLRSTLKRLIKDIVVLVIQVNRERVAIADIELKNGRRRQVIVAGEPVELPQGLRSEDVRDWQNWPDRLKQSHFETFSPEARKMVELEDAGHNRTEIGKQMGVSPARVSRILRGLGRAKLQRKPTDSERLMNWHPQGRGWVKTYRGQRYFIGVGKLKAMFPRLVREKTEAGTWKAANRWWQRQQQDLGKDD